MAGAEMEMLAGDAEAAERELRDAIDVATEMGASYYVALYRTRIAHVLVVQGRDEDALAELELTRSVFEDAPKWKTARARVLAHRGQTEEAVALARDAADLHGRQRRRHHARRDPRRPRGGAPRARRRSRGRRCARGGARAARGEGEPRLRGALPSTPGGDGSRVGAHDPVSRRQPRGTSTTIVGSSRPAQRLPDETGDRGLLDPESPHVEPAPGDGRRDPAVDGPRGRARRAPDHRRLAERRAVVEHRPRHARPSLGGRRALVDRYLARHSGKPRARREGRPREAVRTARATRIAVRVVPALDEATPVHDPRYAQRRP